MTAHLVARMNSLAIRDTGKALSSSYSPFDFIPPELLSHIFDEITHTSYSDEKITFARLCLVSSQFLPVAQDHLYRKLVLDLSPATPPSTEYTRRDNFQHPSLQLLALVKEARIFFDTPEGLPRLAQSLQDMTNVQHLYVEDKLYDGHDSVLEKDPGEFERRNATSFHIASTLVDLHERSSLRTLIIPRIRLSPCSASHLITGLPHLQIYRGAIFGPDPLSSTSPRSSENPPSSLTRLHVSYFFFQSDLRWSFPRFAHTLRFLTLELRWYSRPTEIDLLVNLETLVVTAHFIPLTQAAVNLLTPKSSTTDQLGNAISTLLCNVDLLVKSGQNLPNFRSYSLMVNLVGHCVINFCENHFPNLPHALEEIAFGPKSVASEEERIPFHLLYNNEDKFPKFKKITLPYHNYLGVISSSPEAAKSITRERVSSWINFREWDFEASKGIEVKWIEAEKWEEWYNEKFYGEVGLEPEESFIEDKEFEGPVSPSGCTHA
ncbi:hypothetical protein JCM3765_005142 [Sporobolomyces pararoseus]